MFLAFTAFSNFLKNQIDSGASCLSRKGNKDDVEMVPCDSTDTDQQFDLPSTWTTCSFRRRTLIRGNGGDLN